MTSLPRVVIHSHFYQPPREDPWLEEIPQQAGAAPWHDWNEKIERECYRAVVAARVLDGDGKIARVMNTLSRMSFDVGPTLFEWMERAAPATYEAILDADRASIARTGHGNAMAQPYHHVILPLASRRDKVTEVRWGIVDFVRRYGRAPEGMWLPETAVDDESLDVLAQEGIQYTILAPAQVTVVPPNGRMGRYITENGREIAIGIYDGNLSHGVAFGRLLVNARVWQSELLHAIARQNPPSLVTIATDGETYGHHHHFSEMALAWLLDELERTGAAEVTNFGAILATDPPARTVRLVEPSSWSCEHGVERWRSNCGCRVAQDVPAHQEWRGPLRTALDALRAELDAVFVREAAVFFSDPWHARDAYGEAVGATQEERDALVATLLRPGIEPQSAPRARELLEMARDCMRMYTSCAWFFDHLTGLEVPQNLRYAARAIDLAGGDTERRTYTLMEQLRAAASGEAGSVTAEDVWAREVEPAAPAPVRLAAGLAAAAEYVNKWRPASTQAFDVRTQGTKVKLIHRRTGREFAYDVTVTMRGIADVSAFVHQTGAGSVVATVPVALEDFPERERAAVRDAVRVPQRHELVRRLLGDATLTQVAHGDLTLLDATIRALTRAASGIDEDPTVERSERMRELLDLLELLGRGAPFDVQTAFAVSIAKLSRAQRDTFTELALRLGFSRAILDVGDA